jgi:hypothetical protein
MSSIAAGAKLHPFFAKRLSRNLISSDKRGEGNPSQSGLRPVEWRPMTFNMKTNKIHSLVLALVAVFWSPLVAIAILSRARKEKRAIEQGGRVEAKRLEVARKILVQLS